MRFNYDTKLLAIVAFTEFLVQHIDDIHPKVIVFLYDPSHDDWVDQMAGHLGGRPMRFLRITSWVASPTVIADDALLLSFINVCDENIWTRFTSNVRTFVVSFGHPNGRNASHGVPRLVFESGARSYFSPCIVCRLQIASTSGMTDRQLVASFAWSAFLDRVDRLPVGDRLACTDDCLMDRAGYLFKGTDPKHRVVTGFRVGVYKLLAELIGAHQIRYYYMIMYVVRQPRVFRSKELDKRLVAKYELTDDRPPHSVSLNAHLKLFPRQFYHGAHISRYVVVVPRILVDSSSNRLIEYGRRCQVVGGLVMSTLFFVMLRYCYQRTDVASLSGSVVLALFFDTFARSMGVGAGPWLGRLSAERLLLSVIAVYAILSGSIFSGVLYEHLVVKEQPQFRFNSLDELCTADMVLLVPLELMPDRPVNRDKLHTSQLFLQ